MAESKFLKFQDIDSDGLIDVCDDEIISKPVPCKGPCIPNPTAIVPDWKTLKVFEPQLNQKKCHFQATKVTPHTTTAPAEVLASGDDAAIDEALRERFEEYVGEAIENLLLFAGKEDSDDTRSTVYESIEYDKYDLEPRPHSRLKLLYSVPFDVIYELPAAQEDTEEDPPEPEEITVEFDTAHLGAQMIRVRKGLDLYGRYLTMYRQLGEGSIYFVDDQLRRSGERTSYTESGTETGGAAAETHGSRGEGTGGDTNSRVRGTVFNLQDYGDTALFDLKELGRLMIQLEAFLQLRGFQIPGVGTIGQAFTGLFDQTVVRLICTFKDYELRRMKIYTRECGEKPFYLNKSSVRPLAKQGVWKDPTAVAYFARVAAMDAELSARAATPWHEFIVKYTYPEVYTDITDGNVKGETVGDCLADALDEEIRDLGQDILDGVFSLGDAIAYKWRKSLCKTDIEESRKDDEIMGISVDAISDANLGEIMGMAQMQAFQQLDKDDQIYLQICVMMMVSKTKFGPAVSMMGKLFEFGFQRIKVCGLFDFMNTAMKCLMGGMTFDEMMSAAVKAALKSMNVENFGSLFQNLPLDAQNRIDAKVKERLANGDLLGDSDGIGQNFFGKSETPGAAAVAGAKGAVGALYEGVVSPAKAVVWIGTGEYRIWESSEILKATEEWTRSGGSTGPGETMGGGAGYSPPNPNAYERTVMSQLDGGAGAQGQEDIPSADIMQLWAQETIKFYGDNLMALVDELNKMPGAEIISAIITMMDCPQPPLFNPSIYDFIKSLGLPFCRNMTEIRLPRLENPLQYFPDFADWQENLWDIITFTFKAIVAIVIINLMVKVCEIIGNALCGALEKTGKIAAAVPAAMAGSTTMSKVIREAFCGPDADEEKIEDTILALMAQMGMGADAYANPDNTLQFGMDLSAGVTQREFAEAFLGNAGPEFLEIADQLIEYEYPQFRASMPNKRAIKRLVGNIGVMAPLEYRQHLRDMVAASPDNELIPANPSMCSNEEQIEAFKNLRCTVLEGRASPEQCHKMFCDLREDMLTDLEDLSDIIQGGIGPYVASQLPPLVSEPGCDDGMIPYEGPAQVAANSQNTQANFEILRVEYAKDMMGNGGLFAGDDDWGFINMVMSDTHGNPLTAHWRKAFNMKKYVNFATNLPNGGEASTGFWSFMQGNAGFSSQVGQFPYYVGEWLKRQFLNAGLKSNSFGDISRSDYVIKPGYAKLSGGGNDLHEHFEFVTRNEATPAVKGSISFADLDFNPIMGTGIDLLKIPDFGYNTTLGIKMPDSGFGSFESDDNKVVITRELRKGNPSGPQQGNWDLDGADICLNFKDNAAGMRKGFIGSNEGFVEKGTWDLGSQWGWGFDQQCYFSDIIEDSNGVVRNRFDDNIRVQIIEKMNLDSTGPNPMADQVGEEMKKAEPVDLPGWIENIPVVGWALQALLNLVLFMVPRAQRDNLNAGMTGGSVGNKFVRSREFEFLAVDDSLDAFKSPPLEKPSIVNENTKAGLIGANSAAPGAGLNLADFPQFAQSMSVLQDYVPQVYLLADFLGTTADSALKDEYDSVMQNIFEHFAYEIGANESGWKYGADYDYLTQTDIDYLDPSGAPYDHQNREMILGISRDQFNAKRDGREGTERAIYLDPATFGGTYCNPALYIKPTKYDGWMGFIQVFFPEYTPCKPHNTDLIDFDEVQEFVDKHYSTIPEDPRLSYDPECVREVPFKRIMDRAARVNMYALVMASIRIYASTHFFKAMGTFSKIMPKFPDNFSSIYSAYILERMEEDFKDVQAPFWESLNPFKDDEFWYGFLEQSVECYDFLVEAGEMPQPTPGGALQSAFDKINDLQTDYAFPDRLSKNRTFTNSDGDKTTRKEAGLREAKMTRDAGLLQTLKGFRGDKNLEAVQSVEEHAKLILQQIINRELTHMGEKMVKNMRSRGFNPTIFDLDYWIFENKCADSEVVFAGPEVVEVPVGLPTENAPDPKGEGRSWPGPYYTPGGEFRVADNRNTEDDFNYGDEYIGFYHGEIDAEGDVVYVAGEEQTGPAPGEIVPSTEAAAAAQDLLTPVATAIKIGTQERVTQRLDIQDATPDGSASGRETITVVDLGDVPDLGTVVGSRGASTPFAIEKYIRINDGKYGQEAGKSLIQRNPPGARLSDIYPGTIETIKNDDGIDVGIKGNMGVRYGLDFYYVKSGKTLITSVEVDSLDLLVSQFDTLQPNSKLLYCLLNMLKNDARYKMMTSYIFSFKKVTGLLAIYNDMAFMSSVGEVSCGKGDATYRISTNELSNLVPGAFKYADPYEKEPWVGEDSKMLAAIRAKPGSRAYISKKITELSYPAPEPPTGGAGNLFSNYSDDDIVVKVIELDPNASGVTGNEGWMHYNDRSSGPGASLFVQEWDTWDRKLLRNSRSRIKKLFRSYYNSRDFRPGDNLLGDGEKPSAIFFRTLKARMMPPPGKGLLPWWKRGRLRSNPFNADGGLCDKAN